MNPRMLSLSLVLGVTVLARPGSAETLQSSAESTARPAQFAVSPEVPGAVRASTAFLGYAGNATTLQVRRYYKVPPPPPPVMVPVQAAPVQAEPPVPAAPRSPSSWLVMRGGVYEAENASKEDWMVGLKGVGKVGPLLRLGATVDLHRRTNSVRTTPATYIDGSGNTVETAVTTAEGESNLVPVLAVAEIMLPIPLLQPYIGVGGGWEFMHVETFDYTSGIGHSANYDGPGWQVYAGADLAIARSVRINGEVFHNEATVQRDVYDPYYGSGYGEEIAVDGTGARLGLSFAF